MQATRENLAVGIQKTEAQTFQLPPRESNVSCRLLKSCIYDAIIQTYSMRLQGSENTMVLVCFFGTLNTLRRKNSFHPLEN